MPRAKPNKLLASIQSSKFVEKVIKKRAASDHFLTEYISILYQYNILSAISNVLSALMNLKD